MTGGLMDRQNDGLTDRCRTDRTADRPTGNVRANRPTDIPKPYVVLEVYGKDYFIFLL